MKFLRFLLTCLATVAVLAVVLVGLAFTPPLQTWFARMELLDQPGVRGSLGSVSAAFGKLEAEDVKVQYGGMVLTLPDLRARLPLVVAVWHRQFFVQGLVAKGWTLDLSRLRNGDADAEAQEGSGDAGVPASAAGIPVKTAAWAFAGILTGRSLPFDGSLDGVDLEGDVIVDAIPGKAPVKVHVTATGGGMAQGREGAFVIDASRVTEDSDAASQPASAHCRLVVSMDSARTLGRAGIKLDLSAPYGGRRVDVSVSASAKKNPGGEEDYSVDITRGDRRVATIQANFSLGSKRVSGKWKVDARDPDLAPFAADRPLPAIAAVGEGLFDADASFDAIHATGQLAVVASGLGALGPSLDRLGSAALDAHFDLVRSENAIHIKSAFGSIAIDHKLSTFVKALQPFDVDEASGALKILEPGSDWLDVSVRNFPLNRLPALPGKLALGAGEATGAFTVRATESGFRVSSRGPITASGVSVERSGKAVARDLELSFPVTAEQDAKQWTFQWAPLTIDGGGRRLMTIDAKGSRPLGADQPLAVAGSWKADLQAIAGLSSAPQLNWVPGRSASGEFTGSIGASSEMECKLTVIGHDSTHVATATVNADEESTGAGEFLAPVKISFGTEVSEVSVEESWKSDKAEPYSEVKLTSDSIALEHLRLLAAPLAAAGGIPLATGPHGEGFLWAPVGVRDRAPFWGDWVGRVTVAFEKLRTGDQDFTDVGGSFEVDHDSIQLEGGHGELPSKSMANMEGSILFDASSDHPYRLTGTESGLSNIDSALLLPPQKGEDPVIEGHFAVAGSISGDGINLDDLMDRTEMKIHLTSTTGIVRILTTDVADAVPETKEPVSDAIGDASHLVGSVLFGIKGQSVTGGRNKVGKVPQAVIDFTNQVAEIGYDKITVTAIRGADRNIRLVDLEMTAPDEHLKGSGKITYVKGLPVSEEPITVEFQLGVHDVLTKLLSTAGLLSPSKDSIGYSLLNEPVRFGGTLAHIDSSQWHDLLAKAASPKPAPAKRAAGTPSP